MSDPYTTQGVGRMFPGSLGGRSRAASPVSPVRRQKFSYPPIGSTPPAGFDVRATSAGSDGHVAVALPFASMGIPYSVAVLAMTSSAADDISCDDGAFVMGSPGPFLTPTGGSIRVFRAENLTTAHTPTFMTDSDTGSIAVSVVAMHDPDGDLDIDGGVALSSYSTTVSPPSTLSGSLAPYSLPLTPIRAILWPVLYAPRTSGLVPIVTVGGGSSAAPITGGYATLAGSGEFAATQATVVDNTTITSWLFTLSYADDTDATPWTPHVLFCHFGR